MSSGPDAPDQAFLRLLDADLASAEQKYRDLSKRLVRFFRIKRCDFAEDLAQETMLRVFQKVGRVTISVDPAAFFQGFANNILREARRIAARDLKRYVPFDENRTTDESDEDPAMVAQADQTTAPFNPLAGDGVAAGHQIDRFAEWRRRLQGLPPDDRALLLAYYSGNKSKRKLLAAENGLSEGALRTKVCRIRAGSRRD